MEVLSSGEDPCTQDPMPCVLQQVSKKPIDEEMVDSLNGRGQGNWKFASQPPNLPLCSEIPPNLNGTMPIDVYPHEFNVTEQRYPTLLAGGRWFPRHCKARHKVAIVIPFRDRETHLKVLIGHLHKLLQKQQLDYAVIVVEQIRNQRMNKAKLMNVAYIEAKKLYPWECFIFHDVDLVPEDDRNLYYCPVQPRHMSPAVDKFKYVLPYKALFGGVIAITPEQFESVNGYSTDYWGWGGEDDDLTERVLMAGYQIARYPFHIGRYTMLKHRTAKGNPPNVCGVKYLRLVKYRWKEHGLQQLEHYVVLKVRFQKLFTHILVDLMENESRRKLNKEVPC